MIYFKVASYTVLLSIWGGTGYEKNKDYLVLHVSRYIIIWWMQKRK